MSDITEYIVNRTQAYEALIQAKATLETTALYCTQQGADGLAVVGMLMGAACIMQDVQDGFDEGKL